MAQRIAALGFCMCCCLAAQPVAAALDTGAVRVEPSEIRAGIFYHGAQVTVTFEAPADSRIAVVLEGARKTVELKEKKKLFGLLWMNAGEIRFENLPTVYKVATGAPRGGGAVEQAELLMAVGYPALEQDAGIAEETDQNDFREYLKLKEREHLYGIMPDRISVSEEGEGSIRGEVVFERPAKASAGRYSIRLFAVENDRVHQLAEGGVTVRQVGAAAFISHLAENHGLAYGVLAAVFAVLIGLLTGVVFGLGGKGGH